MLHVRAACGSRDARETVAIQKLPTSALVNMRNLEFGQRPRPPAPEGPEPMLRPFTPPGAWLGGAHLHSVSNPLPRPDPKAAALGLQAAVSVLRPMALTELKTRQSWLHNAWLGKEHTAPPEDANDLADVSATPLQQQSHSGQQVALRENPAGSHVVSRPALPPKPWWMVRRGEGDALSNVPSNVVPGRTAQDTASEPLSPRLAKLADLLRTALAERVDGETYRELVARRVSANSDALHDTGGEANLADAVEAGQPAPKRAPPRHAPGEVQHRFADGLLEQIRAGAPLKSRAPVVLGEVTPRQTSLTDMFKSALALHENGTDGIGRSLSEDSGIGPDAEPA